MTDSEKITEPGAALAQRLLAGPARPGQAFTMPGCNYDQLYRLARRLKCWFDGHLDADSSVCLFSDDRAVMAAALLASLAGGPQLLLPHALSNSARKELHRSTGFDAIIGPSDNVIENDRPIVDPQTLTDEVETLAQEEETDTTRSWVGLFTGGSTGAPQLWTKTCGNLLGEVDYLINRFALGSNDRILSTVPALHIYGLLYSLLVPLAASARVAAATPSFPEEIKRQMADMAPTVFIGVPVHYRALKESPPAKGTLRLAFSSAGPLAEDDGRAFSKATGVDLIEVYGSTETGGIATRCRAKEEIGFTVYDRLQFRIAGDELDIRSPFLSAELPVRPSGWFTVADRVKAVAGGTFVVTGRADQIVKVGGNRVDLERIRQSIEGLDGIREAYVLARPTDTGREREIAAVVVGSPSSAAIKTALEDTLEPHEMPRRFCRVDSIPLAITGKPDRSAIEELFVPQQLTFEPGGRKVPWEEGRTIHALAAAHDIGIRADCGGLGLCAKCRVRVHPPECVSPPTQAERDGLSPDQMRSGFRLACQARATGAATVTIPDTWTENAETGGKTGIARSYAANSPIHRRIVADGSPGLKSDTRPESLLDWLAAQAGDPLAANADPAALQELARYRGSLKDFTLVVHADSGIRRIFEGRQPTSLGFAVDLGTTSVAGYLCDLTTGALLAADACVNPQRRFGEDVISRISRINENEDLLEQMQRLAVEAINWLITRCLEKIGGACRNIDEVAVCGNTTMQQIFAGLNPHGLGVAPYFPITLTPPATTAASLGLAVGPAVPVFLMPVISGFVGGDTLAAILADRPHERDETTLIVDIGTNGEVVLGSRKELWVTSCATGPALEGAQISCGMRAVTGAIHRVRPGDGAVAYEVMGDANNRPMGICGSGIIDAIAALHQLGVILPNGRLNETSPGVAVNETGVGRQFTIVSGEHTATGSDIAVTLKDVRQIQLAKAALCTGIEFLMRRAGIEKIDRTILTGAFGARFNWKNAVAIGMLPFVVAQGEVAPADNLAGVGVVKALLDADLRVEARDLCRRIRYLELAADPEFAMAFARATAFPDHRAHP